MIGNIGGDHIVLAVTGVVAGADPNIDGLKEYTTVQVVNIAY
jgi:hypothetical protein